MTIIWAYGFPAFVISGGAMRIMNTEYLSTHPEWATLPRLIPLQGGYNFRDLGGYPTSDGRFTAWGKIYRSGDFSKLTSEDVTRLERFEINTLIDFRTEGETELSPNKLPASIVNKLQLSIDPANVTTLKRTLPSIDETMMENIYGLFVREFQPTYTRFFDILSNNQAAPILFHCSGGKDRTGFAAAMLLSALGVSRDIIMEDYLVSVGQAAMKYAKELEARPSLAAFLTVKRSYLETAFRIIDDEFGGVDSYLADRLHVDAELMKKLYTQPDLPRP